VVRVHYKNIAQSLHSKTVNYGSVRIYRITKLNKIFFLFSFFFSTTVLAGELAKNSTITEVTNVTNNIDAFAIKLSGGSGLCADEWVWFPASKKQSDSAYNRAFTVALAASMSGKVVRIHNYENDDCKGANFISLYP